jgi:ribA/ribD-fused uncharacterized protein
VTFDGVVYPTNEHAYQAAKSLDPAEREFVRTRVSPNMAKKAGRRNVTLRADWEQVKLKIMEDLVRQKFQDPELKKQILSTGTAELIEGNWWNDTFWGVCNGKGENHLGRILMKVREELKNESK